MHGNNVLRFVFMGGGLVATYSIYSVVQETLTNTRFGGENGADALEIERDTRFKFMTALLLVQSIFNVVVALGMLWWQRIPILTTLHSERRSHAAIAVTYTGAMLCANLALTHLSYAEQVLLKSTKPIAVCLALRLLVAHKGISSSRWLVVVLISLSAGLFMVDEATNFGGANRSKGDSPALGRLFVFASLAFDGLTASLQQKALRRRTRIVKADDGDGNDDVAASKDGAQPSAYHLMLSINLFAIAYLAVLSLVSGELFVALEFVVKYGASAKLALLLCCFSTIGQLFVFRMLSDFGALTVSLTTTARKLVTVAISSSLMANGHPLSFVQWLCTFVVFSCLFFDTYQENRTRI